MVNSIYELAFNTIFFSLALFLYLFFIFFTPVVLISAALSALRELLFLFIYLQEPKHPRLIDSSVNQGEEFGWKTNPSPLADPRQTPRSRGTVPSSPFLLFLSAHHYSCPSSPSPLSVWDTRSSDLMPAAGGWGHTWPYQSHRVPAYRQSCQGAIPPLSLLTSQRQCSF